MTLCPHCGKFQRTTRCPVPRCGGFICPCSGRCNRADHYDLATYMAADDPHASDAAERSASETAASVRAGDR